MVSPETAGTISSVASASTYGASGGSLVAVVNGEFFIGLCGVVIALLGLLVNIYFKQQHLKLARARAAAEDSFLGEGD